jgi:hypothetical protein
VDIEQNYSSAVKRIVKKVELENRNGDKHPQEPLEKILIGEAEPWIVQNARAAGLNIEGYKHEISNYFIRHVINTHGDPQKELERGNLPVHESDFEEIPMIIEQPTYIVFGAKRNGEDRIIYAKNQQDGTTIYFEEILTGKSNRSLRGNTMYKTKKILDKDSLIANITMNGKTDIAKAIITGMDGGQAINTANS